MKSPLFKGGGRVFGPRPRDYGFKVNKKEKVLARKSALASKAKDGVVSVLEDFTFNAPKTKDFLALLNAFSLANTKTLLVLADVNDNVFLSGRNLQKANVVTATQITTYDVLNADKVLIIESAVSKIESLLN